MGSCISCCSKQSEEKIIRERYKRAGLIYETYKDTSNNDKHRLTSNDVKFIYEW